MVEKYFDARIDRLNKSLMQNNVNESDLREIMEGGNLIKKGTQSKDKHKWLMHAMEKLDRLICDNELKYKIMQDCACRLGGKLQEMCEKYYKEYPNIEERIEAINKIHGMGYELKIIGKGKYQVTYLDPNQSEYKCFCLGKVNFDEIKMPIIYCYCSAGHIKYFLEIFLNKKLNVKCISSILASKGKENCIFVFEELSE